MHAGIAQITQNINQVMRLGTNTDEITPLIDRAGGTLLANGMAILLKLGFGYLLREGLLDKEQSQKAKQFFEHNFEIVDPYAENGKRYYQGKFLIRTRKPDDDMNVWLRFCPEPENLYQNTPFGKTLNPLAVVATKTLDEKEADSIEQDPDKVDLVIKFKDAKSIVSLIGRPEVDIVGLLLENLVQLEGNMGHLFKLGAIAQNIESMIDIPQVLDQEEYSDE